MSRASIRARLDASDAAGHPRRVAADPDGTATMFGVTMEQYTLIAHAPTDLRLLLAVADALKLWGRFACDRIPEKFALSNEEWEAATCGVCPACHVNAALDALEAGE